MKSVNRMVSEDVGSMRDDLPVYSQANVADIDRFAPLPHREDCPMCFLTLP